MELIPTVAKNNVFGITAETWRKRCHTSQYGIGDVTDTITDLLVDFEIL